MPDDEYPPGHRSWVTSMTEARNNCRESVAEALARVGNPERAVWPREPPDPPGAAGVMTAHYAAMSAHVAVMDYADHLRPYADELDRFSGTGDQPSLWHEKLGEVDLGGVTSEVSLETLPEWESVEISISERSEHELEGEQTTDRIVRILLPVSIVRACHRQLNSVVKELGFAAETKTPVADLEDAVV